MFCTAGPKESLDSCTSTKGLRVWRARGWAACKEAAEQMPSNQDRENLIPRLTLSLE